MVGMIWNLDKFHGIGSVEDFTKSAARFGFVAQIRNSEIQTADHG